jgi:DNA-binding transcriptional MerR regulator
VGYTATQASRLSGCSPAQLESWDRAGLVRRRDGDEGPYAFRDLVALRMVRSLLDAGLSLTRIRRAVTELAQSGEELAELRLVTDGDHVWACRDDGQILDALGRGQMALFVAVDRLAAEVEADVREFSRDRQSFLDGLRSEGGRSDGRGDHPARS